MEFGFSPARVVALIVLLVVFALLDGFTPPFFDEEMSTGFSSTRLMRGWFYCVLLFVSGAVLATVVDHWVGLMPPSNWRPLYMIGGVVLMVVAVVWYRSMLSAWTMPFSISEGD